METITFDVILGWLNTGALVVFTGLLLTGKVLPRSIVDEIVSKAEATAIKAAAAICEDLSAQWQHAIQDAILQAINQIKEDSKEVDELRAMVEDLRGMLPEAKSPGD